MQGLINTDVVFRSLIEIKAWLGRYIPGSDEYPLVDFNGNPLRWPERISVPITGDVQLHLERLNMPSDVQDRAALPAFASSGPSTFRAGALIPEVFGNYWYRLHQQAEGDDAISAVNAVSSVETINSPGRIDADGSVQATPYPNVSVGTIPTTSPIANIVDPMYEDSFGATIVSSEIVPEIRDDLTGAIIELSRQVLVLDVPDRTEAGLSSTPIGYNSSVFPDFMIEGRGFHIVRIEETASERVRMTVSSLFGYQVRASSR